MGSVEYVQSLIDTGAVWVGLVGTTAFLVEYTLLGFVGPEETRLKWWKSHAGRAIIALDVGLWFVFAPVCWLLLRHDQTQAAILALLDHSITLAVSFNWLILIGLTIAALVPCYRAVCLFLMYRTRRKRICHKVSPPNQS